MSFWSAEFNHIKHRQQPYFHFLPLLCLTQMAKQKYSAYLLLEPLFPVLFKQHTCILLKFIPLLCEPLVSAHAGKWTNSSCWRINIFQSGFARIGALITPFIAQVISNQSQQLAASVYGVVTLVAAIACCLLPIETKGRDMAETSGPKKKKKRKPPAPAPVHEFDNPINFES